VWLRDFPGVEPESCSGRADDLSRTNPTFEVQKKGTPRTDERSASKPCAETFVIADCRKKATSTMQKLKFSALQAKTSDERLPRHFACNDEYIRSYLHNFVFLFTQFHFFYIIKIQIKLQEISNGRKLF